MMGRRSRSGVICGTLLVTGGQGEQSQEAGKEASGAQYLLIHEGIR